MYVYAVGYPGVSIELQQSSGAAPIDSTQTEGAIEGVITTLMRWNPPVEGRQLHVILHGARILPGNSGGPLFDDCGRVIGINAASPLMELKPGCAGARWQHVDRDRRAGQRRHAREQGVAFHTVTDACAPSTTPTPSPTASGNASPAPAASPAGESPGSKGADPAQRRPIWVSIATGVGIAALVGLVLLAMLRRFGRRNPRDPNAMPAACAFADRRFGCHG